jgi:hypothetical protein
MSVDTEITAFKDNLTDKVLTTKVLEIINNGISGIIGNIKQVSGLGVNNLQVDQNVSKILNSLLNITDKIEPVLTVMTTKPPDYGYFKIDKDDTKQFDKYTYDSTGTSPGAKYFTNVNADFKAVNEKNNYRDTKLTMTQITNLQTLDSDALFNKNVHTTDGLPDTENTNINIQKRLNNCYTLELLYMRKHEEVLKLFAFILNLFDKYKYAIKIILFLLQKLVYRDNKVPPPPINPNIKLPRPLIKRIDLMVKDQANIQNIVDGIDKHMKTDQDMMKINPIIDPTKPLGSSASTYTSNLDKPGPTTGIVRPPVSTKLTPVL